MKLTSFQSGLALLAGASAISLICAATPAVAALPPADGGSSNPAVAHLVADAQKAIKAGKLPLAVIDLKNASSADPHNGPVRAELGAVLTQTGDFYSAERELRQARRDGAADQAVLPSLFQTMLARGEEKQLLDEFPEPAAPSNTAPDILKARALAFLNLNQTADAFNAMDKSLKLRRDAAGLLLRARISQKAGALPEAIQYADQAIAMAPNNIEGPLLKVSMLLASNDLNGALALTDQLVAKFPTSVPAQASQIEVLIRMNKNDQAKAAVDAMLAKYPQSALAVYYHALLMARSGDTKKAWGFAQSLPQDFLRSQPGVALSVSQMAIVSGDVETGSAILASAISHYPLNTELRLRLAQVRARQNDIKGALNALEPVKDSLDPVIVQALAAAYVRANRTGEAVQLLQRLTQSGKAPDAATLQLVRLEAQTGQSEQALKDLTTAVNQKPTDALLAGQLINALTTRGRSADALAVADNLSKDPTQRVTSLVFRGQVLMQQHKADDALASYAKAMQADPKSQAALSGHAAILEQMRRYDEASADVHTMLNLNPGSMVAYLALAEIEARQNQDEQVRSTLAEAIKVDPQDPAPRLTLTRYLVEHNDRTGALNVVNDLLKVHPNNDDGVALLGGIQMATGKKAQAVTTFRRLVTLAPRAPGSHIFLGNALFVNGDRAGANAALRDAVSLAPASADVRLAQITLQFAQKDINGAVGSAEAYRNANPGLQGDILLGDTLGRAGRRDQARVVYQKSFSTNPNSGVLLRLASNLISSGDTKSAGEVLSNWVGKNPDDNAVRLEYATLLMKQADNSGAIRQFREVLGRDPNNVASLNDLAWLTRDQDANGAIALATKAAALAPNLPEVLDTLGWIKLKHGKPADSLPLFKRAHDLRPQDGEISYHLAVGLEATGSHDAAKGFLNALLTSQIKFDDLAEANKLAQSWH